MKNNKLLFLLAILCVNASANDSTGYVGTGGVTYIKNKNIQMLSEDLFISKKTIKVNYQYKNLSSKDVTETVLFPLPRVDNFFDGGDFANTEQLLNSFKITVDGKQVKPTMHVRTFIEQENNQEPIDVTELFKQCGFLDSEMIAPWKRSDRSFDSDQKLRQCKNTRLQNIVNKFGNNEILWSSQIIYSWEQKFKANAITKVNHQYSPLVGGSVGFTDEYEGKEFCMDKSFKAGLKKSNSQNSSYSALEYILTTGANWANPIEDFKLTIERDEGELVSFCWAGKVNKISSNQFQIKEQNFVPKQDLNIIFIKKYRN